MSRGSVASQVCLHRIALPDAERIHEWASHDEAVRYQPWGPNSWEDTQAFVGVACEAWEERPQTRWVWAAHHPDAGVVGLGELHLRSRHHATIGYAVHVGHWGQGIGRRIAFLLCGFGFGTLRLERIEATCDPRNAASAAVLRATGMTYEGTLRHTMLLRDGWRDSEMYSVLAQEWSGAQ